MAFTGLSQAQLGVYNDALLMIGERMLAADEDTPLRSNLDQLMQTDKVGQGRVMRFCLELIKPEFAIKQAGWVELNGVINQLTQSPANVPPIPVPPEGAGLQYVPLPLPDDWLEILEIHSNKSFTAPMSQYYFGDGNLFAAWRGGKDAVDADQEFGVHVRYVSNDFAAFTDENIGKWTPSFREMIVARLAQSLAMRRTPKEQAAMGQMFESAAKIAAQIEQGHRPQRVQPVSMERDVLSGERANWEAIYNDALMILGLPRLTSFDDQSEGVLSLHTSRNSGAALQSINLTGWQWALKGVTIEGVDNDGLLPGYQDDHHLFIKPADFLRVWGVWNNNNLGNPVAVEQYFDEGDYLIATRDDIFLQYIPKSARDNPSKWPIHFRRLVAASMAKDCSHLAGKGMERVEMVYAQRLDDAKTIDAMSSPPKKLAQGSWVRSRRAVGGFDRYGNEGRFDPPAGSF